MLKSLVPFVSSLLKCLGVGLISSLGISARLSFFFFDSGVHSSSITCRYLVPRAYPHLFTLPPFKLPQLCNGSFNYFVLLLRVVPSSPSVSSTLCFHSVPPFPLSVFTSTRALLYSSTPRPCFHRMFFASNCRGCGVLTCAFLFQPRASSPVALSKP